jgi:TRAP-type uncharacterized transport system fused permease subunit
MSCLLGQLMDMDMTKGRGRFMRMGRERCGNWMGGFGGSVDVGWMIVFIFILRGGGGVVLVIIMLC